MRLELREIVIPFIFMAVYIIVKAIACKIKHKKFYIKNEIVKTVFVGYIGALLSVLIVHNTHLVITPQGKLEILGASRKMLNLVPFKTIKEQLSSHTMSDIENVIINLLVMVPFSALIKAIKPKFKNYICVFIPFITAIIIEMVQYFIGRSCDIDDIMLNIIGSIVGLSAYNMAIKHKKKSC